MWTCEDLLNLERHRRQPPGVTYLLPRCRGVQRGHPSLPGRVEIVILGEATVELQDRHSVRECPRSAGEITIVSGRPDRREDGAVFAARAEQRAIQRAVVHQPVEVRVLLSEGPVDLGQGEQWFVGGIYRSLAM